MANEASARTSGAAPGKTVRKSAVTGRFVARTTASGAVVVPLPPLTSGAGYHDRELEKTVLKDLARIRTRLRQLRGA